MQKLGGKRLHNENFGSEIYFETNRFERLSELLKQYAPYGKVAVFLTEKDFLEFSSKITFVLKKAGNKVVFITFKTPFEFSVDKVCALFNLHEDARMVLTFGVDLIQVADYFATVRKIRSVAVTVNFNDRLFNPRLSIKNASSLDCFIADCKKSIIVTEQKGERSEILALIAEKKFALFDYYARTLFTHAEFDDISVNEIINYLNIAENLLCKNDMTDDNYVQIYNNLSSALLVDRESGGIFFGTSICALTEQFVEKNFSFSKKLFVCVKTLRTVEKIIAGKSETYAPDYNQLAQTVSETLNIDCSLARKALLKQIKAFSVISAGQVAEFKRAIIKTTEYVKCVLIKYFAFGGKNKRLTPAENVALSLCGNTPIGVNLMSVARELPFIV